MNRKTSAVIREGENFPLGLTPKLPAHRYEALDSLRGICAILVCLFHFRANGPIATSGFIRGSWLFVDFFFVLSGFVISANYSHRLLGKKSFRDFIVLRFGRIYPLHFVMLLAYVLVEITALGLRRYGLANRMLFDEYHSSISIFTNITLTQAFGIHNSLTWNQPSWSIAVEFWTYILFAAAAIMAARNLEKIFVIAIIISISVLLVVTPGGINVTYSWSMVRCILGFSVGAIAWHIWRNMNLEPGRTYIGATAIEILAAVGVVVFVSYCGKAPVNVTAPLLFGLVVALFAMAGGNVSRLLLWSPLQFLGKISFSVYMVHAFVQSRFDDALRIIERHADFKLTSIKLIADHDVVTLVGKTPLQGVILTLVMLGVVVGLSAFTWRYVELPGQRFARSRAA